MKKLLLIAVLGLAGCAGTNSTGPVTGDTTPGYMGYIEPATSLVCGAVMQLAVSPDDRVQKANMIAAIAHAVRSLSTGTVPTVQEVKDVITLWAPDKAHWADLSTSIGSVYAGVYNNIKGDPKVALQVLEKIAEGCEDASVPYLKP